MTNTTKTPFWAKLKKAVASDSFKAIAVLAIFALLSSLVLSVVHRFTIVDEVARLKQKIGEAYTESPVQSQIDTDGYDNVLDSEILGAYLAEDGACIIVSKSNKAYNASMGITLFVIVKDGVIIKVADYASSETPGLGTRALKDTYLNQYIGIEAKELAFVGAAIVSPSDTTSTDVGLITGATKSSKGVKTAVEAAATFYVKEVAK